MPMNDRFATLFRASLFAYYPVESGCPALYEMAPFGTRLPIAQRMAAVLGARDDAASLSDLYAEYVVSFSDVVAAFELTPGRYEVVDVSGTIDGILEGVDEQDAGARERAERAYAEALDTSFSQHRTMFEVTETHMAMIRRAKWQVELDYSPLRGEESEVRTHIAQVVRDTDAVRARPEHAGALFPSPVATGDGKRPYGDRSYYYWDLEDFGVPGVSADEPSDVVGERGRFSAAAQDRIDRIQRETVLALQALAQYGTK